MFNQQSGPGGDAPVASSSHSESKKIFKSERKQPSQPQQDLPKPGAGSKPKRRKGKPRDRGWIIPKYQFRPVMKVPGVSKSLTYVKKTDSSLLRAPWVPAPAKSTNSVAVHDNAWVDAPTTTASNTTLDKDNHADTYNPTQVLKKSSRVAHSSTYLKGAKQRHPTSLHGLGGGNPTNKSQPTKKSASKKRDFKYSTLESKDSLIDVTVCLQKRRKEVMKLWQNALAFPQNNSILVSAVESVNKLALEATEDVELLRATIQNLQKKSGGLSNEDCEKLHQLRAKVLSTVKQFEAADKALQERMGGASHSKSTTSIHSQTDEIVGGIETTQHLPNPTIVPKKLVFSPRLRDVEFSNPPTQSERQEVVRTVKSPPRFPTDKSTTATVSGVPSVDNLSRIHLFPDNISVGRTQSCNSGLEKMGKHSQRRKTDSHHQDFEKRQSSSDSDSLLSRNTDGMSNIYREKISFLRRKLMNTENEVEELKSDVERIESDANFRVRLLQSSVEDKFESLKAIPDYLQMVDAKLGESVHAKAHLQRELYETKKLLHEEQNLGRSLKTEAEDLRGKLQAAESLKEFQTMKISELEKSNYQLKQEAEEAMRLNLDLSEQIQLLREKVAAQQNYQPPTVMENERLKSKYTALKEELGDAKRIIHSLKKSKAKVTSELNQKIEELLELLQAAQSHKRILTDQIRQLKKSYNELFPCDCESHLYDHFGTCKTASKSKPEMTKSKSRSKSKTKHESRTSEAQPAYEPPVIRTTAWTTGNDEEIMSLTEDKLRNLTQEFFASKSGSKMGDE